MSITKLSLPRVLCACLLLALFASVLGGCESYSAPVLSVTKAEPLERTTDGCSMLFTLDARNDNVDALPLRTVEYTVDLNGQEVFHGKRSAEATLRRLGIQQLHLPAAMPVTPGNADLLGGPTHYRLTGSLYYVTPGRLAETLFDAGVHTPSVSFSFEGDIDLSTARFTSNKPPLPKVESVEAPTDPAPAEKP
ncbi:MAG TPA: LEA type 2 family protein [Phycisphaerales bacterium]|jgi:hypothetical protein|nr:LEA type 2 family protein [Phycisphaerales bacterium]